MRNRLVCLGVVVFVWSLAFLDARARELSFEERVKAQEAIERVYWSHRIWPKQNPGPKPPLSAVLPDAAIRAKVEDFSRMSTTLDSFWARTPSGEELQAEIERMASRSRAPGMLRDLFRALDDDPFLIAECLARPALTRRLVDSAFAADARIHGAQRASLASRLRGVEDIAALDRIEGEHVDFTIALDDGDALPDMPAKPSDHAVHLSRNEWDREIHRLSASIGPTRSALASQSPRPGSRADFSDAIAGLAVGRVSGILDLGDRFGVVGVRTKSSSKVTITSVSWAKRTYPEWSVEVAGSSAHRMVSITPPARGYSRPEVTGSDCAYDTWTVTAGSEVPDERAYHTAVWTGSEMIVWGGFGSNGYVLGTGGRYDPATDSWTVSQLTTGSGANVPSARSQHTAVWTGSEMIVWGGIDQSRHPVNTGGRYNPTTDTWAASSLTTGNGDNVPSAREFHTAVWTGSEMIIWGGYNYYGEGAIGTGGRYSPATDTWAPTSTDASAPAARFWHTAVWTGSEMIVWGGEDQRRLPVSTGGRYDPSTDAWASSSLMTGTGANVPTPRFWHTAVWTGSEMIVWGGMDAYGYTSTGGRYSPATDSWSLNSLATGTGANVPKARVFHTAVWTGSEMIVWSGSGAGGYTDTGGRYSAATDSWAASSLTTGSGANVPSARTGHTAVWTGTEMIVWGGTDSMGANVLTGGRYDPVTDSWAASSLTTGVPSYLPITRNDDTAVWTGSEMIVWGGYGFGGPPLNTGGRYDPATDSWATTALTTGSGPNVAPAAFMHTAVWTGAEMIVWGGYNKSAGGVLRTGGRYNPTTDSWTPSSLVTGTGANVPEARNYHTAVWTGTEMIVWGGYGRTSLLNTGGRYDPVTDSWAASSLTTGSGANVPQARNHHSAVWTGAEMIVWGGITNYSAVLNTGGRYDPTTDSWVASSLTTGSGANVPIGRGLHTAVWTGSEMIVWGGARGGTTNTGGRYEPTSDTWASSSLTSGSGANVPEARYNHTAVWTGAEMIVWGGYDGTQLRTGGRYDPTTDSWADSSLTAATGDYVPAPRESQSVAWTGPGDQRMIVWGGFPRTHSGGLYCAKPCGAPTGSITFPVEGACYGSSVTVKDDFSSACDADLSRGYDPAGGPTYAAHGDYAVTVTATDHSGRSSSDRVTFTIDTIPPVVRFLRLADQSILVPSTPPMDLLFTDSDDDGATGGVVHEVMKLSGCTIYDGATYGNGDGLLSDESIELTVEELCRLAALCGFTSLEDPVLSVEATDCGGNVGSASEILRGSVQLWPGVCGATGTRPTKSTVSPAVRGTTPQGSTALRRPRH